MANLRLRIELNKGRKGIKLEKLEKMLREMRKFLTQISEDLHVKNPDEWTGLDFRNGSLSYTAINPTDVSTVQADFFASNVGLLARGLPAPNVRHSTMAQFHNLVEPLDSDERARIAVYPPEKKRARWMTISRSFLNLPDGIYLTERESVGSAQGIIHSLFKESREPYFNLRDLYSGRLIKCSYPPDKDHYDAIVEALRVPDRIVHVHGMVRTNSGDQKQIESIEVDRILLADPYEFKDVLEFLNSGKTQ